MIGEAIYVFDNRTALYNNARGSQPHDVSIVDLEVDYWWKTVYVDLIGTGRCSEDRLVTGQVISIDGGWIAN